MSITYGGFNRVSRNRESPLDLSTDSFDTRCNNPIGLGLIVIFGDVGKLRVRAMNSLETKGNVLKSTIDALETGLNHVKSDLGWRWQTSQLEGTIDGVDTALNHLTTELDWRW